VFLSKRSKHQFFYYYSAKLKFKFGFYIVFYFNDFPTDQADDTREVNKGYTII